jgi:hypothetical protein
VQVVQQGSAMLGVHNPIEVDEDHSSICKPSSMQANTYRFLKRYLEQVLQAHKVSMTCVTFAASFSLQQGTMCRPMVAISRVFVDAWADA